MILDEQRSNASISKKYGIATGTLSRWVQEYLSDRIEGLSNNTGGNPLSKYQRTKHLTREEQLEYENLQLRIESMRLKKRYSGEEVNLIKKRLSEKTTK